MKYKIKGTGRRNSYGDAEFGVHRKFMGIWWPAMTWVWEKTTDEAVAAAKRKLAEEVGGLKASVEFDV